MWLTISSISSCCIDLKYFKFNSSLSVNLCFRMVSRSFSSFKFVDNIVSFSLYFLFSSWCLVIVYHLWNRANSCSVNSFFIFSISFESISSGHRIFFSLFLSSNSHSDNIIYKNLLINKINKTLKSEKEHLQQIKRNPVLNNNY